MFLYSQSTGELQHNGEPIGVGYSGHDDGLNNPEMQNVHAVGPLPQGSYNIGRPFVDERLGPVVMALQPWSSNVMFLRGDFYIHGDNAQMDFTGSDGCIVLGHAIRNAVAAAVLAGDNELEVVA